MSKEQSVSQDSLKIAVFIDFDNIEIGVKTTLNREFDVGAVLDAIKERGEVITKMAYGDWKKVGDYSKMMTQHAVRMVQRNMTPGGDKNGADINLALDALEMAFTHDHINAFVIVGGDSDFISLVEKLKQYDRKVFVVGGRQFTGMVMQKNCTEFIAYENLIRQPSRRQSAPSGQGQGQGQGQGHGRGERQGAQAPAPASLSTAPMSKAFPLVTRALEILTDREVTPQLGLLKSTLLQLDSAFSERDYGASSFRDFADKLAEAGLVTLRSAGRSVMVELRDAGEGAPPAADGALPAADGALPVEGHEAVHVADAEPSTASAPRSIDAPVSGPVLAQPDGEDQAGQMAASRDGHGQPPSLVDGIRLLQTVLGTPGAIPRWPMYIRNVKQAMRAVDPSFDERKHGNLVEILRSVQRDGLVRLDRDRQGVLRVFQGPQMRAIPVEQPEEAGVQPDLGLAAGEQPAAVDVVPETMADQEEAQGIDTTAVRLAIANTASLVEVSGNVASANARPTRRRKSATAAPKVPTTAARKPRARMSMPRKKKETKETESE
jgi:uncharacterized LabA/DUF88 family protein